MRNHDTKFRFLPLLFSAALGFCVLLHAAPLMADDLAPVLPQFTPFNPPHEITNLAFKDKDGEPHKLSDYYGHLILVNLWATWCPPCRAELPALDHLQTVYKTTDFRILPISLDDPNDSGKITAFYNLHHIQGLPIFKDPEFSLLKELHPDGLPASYLITPDGKAVGMVEGIADWDGPEAANLIEAYLPQDKNKSKKK